VVDHFTTDARLANVSRASGAASELGDSAERYEDAENHGANSAFIIIKHGFCSFHKVGNTPSLEKPMAV
jgi:hypothetical protein